MSRSVTSAPPSGRNATPPRHPQALGQHRGDQLAGRARCRRRGGDAVGVGKLGGSPAWSGSGSPKLHAGQREQRGRRRGHPSGGHGTGRGDGTSAGAHAGKGNRAGCVLDDHVRSGAASRAAGSSARGWATRPLSRAGRRRPGRGAQRPSRSGRRRRPKSAEPRERSERQELSAQIIARVKVWIPHEQGRALLGEVPDGVTVEVCADIDDLPSDPAGVRFWVPPFLSGRRPDRRWWPSSPTCGWCSCSRPGRTSGSAGCPIASRCATRAACTTRSTAEWVVAADPGLPAGVPRVRAGAGAPGAGRTRSTRRPTSWPASGC